MKIWKFIESVLRWLYGLVKRRISYWDKGFPVEPYRFSYKDALDVFRVVRSGKLHHKVGLHVRLLEKEFAAYHGVKYALATNSGTSALEMAIKAVGVGPGDEVIVPAYTFVATAQAVLNRGGVPVFADIDDTFTIAPESVHSCITGKTKAIIPVHIFGNPANMDAIMGIARKHNVRVIEDACQAAGARYKGKPVGSIGDIGCFSFDIQKAIYTGQGGMLITNTGRFYTTALHTRETGQLYDDRGSDVVTTGNTYAMTEMQGVLARNILRRLDTLNSKRRDMYWYFVDTVRTEGLPVRWYRVLPDAEPSYSRLVFMVDFVKLGQRRETIIARMHALGVPMKTFYPVPLYRYSLFRKRYDRLTKTSFPFSTVPQRSYGKVRHSFTEAFCAGQVGLNWSPYIRQAHVDALCRCIDDLRKDQSA